MSGSTVADRQRERAERSSKQTRAAMAGADVPKQRRAGLAALALLLIVGGALGAGLLAMRVDTREPVLVAAVDIAPGAEIKASMLTEADVASEGLRLIPAELSGQILTARTYARSAIRAGSLLDENNLTRVDPIENGRAIVSIPLTDALVPTAELDSDDLVQIMRVSRNDSGAPAQPLTQALVLSVDSVSEGSGLASGGGSLSLLVPAEAAADVVNAAAADVAGVALLKRGQDIDTKLETGR